MWTNISKDRRAKGPCMGAIASANPTRHQALRRAKAVRHIGTMSPAMSAPASSPPCRPPRLAALAATRPRPLRARGRQLTHHFARAIIAETRTLEGNFLHRRQHFITALPGMPSLCISKPLSFLWTAMSLAAAQARLFSMDLLNLVPLLLDGERLELRATNRAAYEHIHCSRCQGYMRARSLTLVSGRCL